MFALAMSMSDIPVGDEIVRGFSLRNPITMGASNTPSKGRRKKLTEAEERQSEPELYDFMDRLTAAFARATDRCRQHVTTVLATEGETLADWCLLDARTEFERAHKKFSRRLSAASRKTGESRANGRLDFSAENAVYDQVEAAAREQVVEALAQFGIDPNDVRCIPRRHTGPDHWRAFEGLPNVFLVRARTIGEAARKAGRTVSPILP
jgi:hypothetical protein